jgi:nucleotide-binding universal stress UspA family protein
MLRPRRILVATDLSEAADEALRQAHEWALAAGASFEVCHIVANPMRSNPLFPQRSATQATEFTDLMERAQVVVGTRVATITGREASAVTTLVDDGVPYARVVQLAEDRHVDVLVVGSHGYTGLRQALLGSVADKIVRYAHCAVLVARPQPTRTHAVVAASDFSDPAYPALEAGAQEAKRRGGKLTMMHCLEGETAIVDPMGGIMGVGVATRAPEVTAQLKKNAREKLHEAFVHFGAEGESLVVEGNAARAIVHAAETHAAELVCLGTHGRTGLRRLLLGSTAELVVKAAPCSVLVVRLADAPGSAPRL